MSSQRQNAKGFESDGLLFQIRFSEKTALRS